MRTNADMTIYRKSVSGGAEVYTSVQIEGVQWESSYAANVLRSGLLEADRITVYVPFSSIDDLDADTGDVIVRGLVTDVIDDDFRISDLRTKYGHGNVATIRSVDQMNFGSQRMRHWQIGAT